MRKIETSGQFIISEKYEIDHKEANVSVLSGAVAIIKSANIVAVHDGGQYIILDESKVKELRISKKAKNITNTYKLTQLGT